jgi:ribosome-interacting GTPase 1
MTKITVLDKYRKTRKPVLVKKSVSREEYIDLLETVETYIKKLYPNNDTSMKIIQEMKFVASLNHKFRENTYIDLKTFSDVLYERIHA